MASSKSKMHNYFKEKFVMQEEEKILKEMLGKFQDQLNRLKIEELALMSLLKMQEQSKSSDKPMPEKTTAGSLDSISDTASIASALPVGLMYENSSDVNKEYLDLNVDLQNHQGNLDRNDSKEEEEYDFESGDDMEDDMDFYE